jgi:hypothetical protein
MLRKLSKATQSRISTAAKRRRKSTASVETEVVDEEERIMRAATLELITKHGGHFVATGLRETRVKGFRVWIITVTLRYAAGHEGYVGDLLYDGDNFTFLTEQPVIDERVRKIAADPEGLRRWNEYRASTL